MIRVVHPGSRIPDPDADFLPIPNPGSRGQKGTGSRIRIRNTTFERVQKMLQTNSGTKITRTNLLFGFDELKLKALIVLLCCLPPEEFKCNL
jgi:hypothetical protein